MKICRLRSNMGRSFGVTLLLLAATGLGGCGATEAPRPATPQGGPAQGAPSPADPLLSLNDAARAAYRDARAAMLLRAGPILVVGPEQMTLIQGEKRTTADALPPVYSDIKMVSHIALGIHSLLVDQDGPLAPERLSRLRAFGALIVKVGAAVEQRGLAPAQLDRTRRLIPQAKGFVDGVLGRGAVQASELVTFERAIQPWILGALEDSARAQLDWAHAKVTAFRATLSPAEWQSLRVVVISGHQPREGSVMMQYFTRLLGEPTEGRRIIYAEGLWKREAALELLGTHLIDASIGEGFFGDPNRMHRDLLSDAAAAYLPKLLPEPPAAGGGGKSATPPP